MTTKQENQNNKTSNASRAKRRKYSVKISPFEKQKKVSTKLNHKKRMGDLSSNKNHKSTKTKRDPSLDLVRGVAVSLMILTHVSGLFYGGSTGIIDFFTWWGATVCFTMFLFVSASTVGIKIQLGKVDKKRILKRFFSLMLIYYTTAYVLSIIRFGDNGSLSTLINVLLFREIPEFTEFMLAFIMFSLIILLLPKQIMKLFIDLRVILPISLLLYVLAQLWYTTTIGNSDHSILRALLVGDDNLHTFGILSYMPVYGLGLWWGGELMKGEIYPYKKAIIAFGLTFGTFLLLNIFALSEWVRWPPSPLFLLYGIGFSWSLILLTRLFKKLDLLFTTVTYLGMNALLYYMIHIILLYIMAFFIKDLKFGQFSTFLIFVVVMAFNTCIIYQFQELKQASQK